MPADAPLKCVRARIEGRVQGVGFRAWVADEAYRRHLRGWVRNCTDGSVEAEFAGPRAQVDDMLAACRTGPPAARVAGMLTAEVEDDGTPGFRQLPTV